MDHSDTAFGVVSMQREKSDEWTETPAEILIETPTDSPTDFGSVFTTSVMFSFSILTISPVSPSPVSSTTTVKFLVPSPTTPIVTTMTTNLIVTNLIVTSPTPHTVTEISAKTITATMPSRVIPTKSLNDRDLLIGVAIGAGPFIIAITIFLFGRHIKRVSKRKGPLKSEGQYSTTYLPRDPSVETPSFYDDDARIVQTIATPLGYSDIDQHNWARTSLSITGRINPYTRLSLVNSPETSPNTPSQLYSVPTPIQIRVLPTTMFSDERNQAAENPRGCLHIDSASSSSHERIVRPLPSLPIPRQEADLDSAGTLVNEIVETPLPPVSSSMATLVHDERHTDSGIRLGKQTLTYELSFDTNSVMNSESSLKSKKRPPPIYTNN